MRRLGVFEPRRRGCGCSGRGCDSCVGIGVSTSVIYVLAMTYHAFREFRDDPPRCSEGSRLKSSLRCGWYLLRGAAGLSGSAGFGVNPFASLYGQVQQYLTTTTDISLLPTAIVKFKILKSICRATPRIFNSTVVPGLVYGSLTVFWFENAPLCYRIYRHPQLDTSRGAVTAGIKSIQQYVTGAI